MAYSEQWNGYVAIKQQSARGTPESGAGAAILRTTGGQGGRLTKAAIESQEVRQDGMSTRGRHGMQKTAGSYTGELSVGTYEQVIQSVMRGTWGSADLAITEADMTSITTTANTIVAASGSWIAKGLRVGDVVRLSNHASAANNGINIRLTGVTALTLTTAETLVLNATPDTAFTLTRPGKVLINPAAGALVKRYWSNEEHEFDLDASEFFPDICWGMFKVSMTPNGMIGTEMSWVGTGVMQKKDGADAPVFSSPSITTSDPLAVVDAVVRLGTGDVLELTSFDLTVDIRPESPDLAATKVGVDVFTGSMIVTMNLAFLRKDLLAVADFIAETPLSLHVLAAEPEASPADFVSIFVPNFTLGGVDKSALAKPGGPRTVTVQVPAALIGKDNRGGAFDPTMVKWQSTGA